ncbi:hypothetical protein [Thalassobaculum sp.]|uniref:hypothetical protein n=1 Tax=Thalassobaculum sp. TaxID=2022740 RepID=UPI003B59F754
MDRPSDRQDIIFRADPFATRTRRFLTSIDEAPEGAWQDLVRVWFDAGGVVGQLPDYARFDILNLPARHWCNTCLTKLVGEGMREFRVVMIGSAIEAHNGFFGNNRPMRELPLKNRGVMRREFAWSLRHGGPVLSEGPYIGAVDYVRSVRRLITPYRISDREYAFIFYAFFEPYPDKRPRL